MPISNSEQKKKHLKTTGNILTNDNKENTSKISPALELNGGSVGGGNAAQTFGLTAEDSNTCFSISQLSDSQGGTEFVSSGPPFSEDSNSQNSDGPTPAKRLLTK